MCSQGKISSNRIEPAVSKQSIKLWARETASKPDQTGSDRQFLKKSKCLITLYKVRWVKTYIIVVLLDRVCLSSVMPKYTMAAIYVYESE